MSIMFTTSVGVLVIDLFVTECPIACENILKLCKAKFYNGCLFYHVLSNYLVQTGDPTGTGKGGMSLSGLINGCNSSISFVDEINPNRSINEIGLVCMSHTNDMANSNKSQFFITLRSNGYEHLKNSTIVGKIVEGINVLQKINELYCDEDGRPYQDVRILHTDILHDPYLDPTGFTHFIPQSSPLPKRKGMEYIPINETVKTRIAFGNPNPKDNNSIPKSNDDDNENGNNDDETIKRKDAAATAVVLEMLGDLPDVDVKPPDEVLFICKLNSVTKDEDLELIFSRFGTIKDCSIVRDRQTGASLQFGFIEFEQEKSCLQAYEKMNNVLIDDRRIKVDFSQSVSGMWNKFMRNKQSKSSISTTLSLSSSSNSSLNTDILSNLNRDQHYHHQQQQQQQQQQQHYSDNRNRNRRDRSRSRSPEYRRDTYKERGYDDGPRNKHHQRDRSRSPESQRRYRDRCENDYRRNDYSRNTGRDRDRGYHTHHQQHHHQHNGDYKRDRRDDDRDGGKFNYNSSSSRGNR
jgi:peptidyl-prolyl cis-trans isomerase-like 4